MMSTFGIVLYFFPEYLLRFFTKDPAVILLGSSIIILCALVQIFDGVQVVTSGILRGFGDTRTALFTNLLAHWCLGLPIGLWLCFGLNKGLWGLWLGLTFGLFITAILNSVIIIRRPRDSWLRNSEPQSLTV
jgi:MATE family multidrug resistance protein